MKDEYLVYSPAKNVGAGIMPAHYEICKGKIVYKAAIEAGGVPSDNWIEAEREYYEAAGGHYESPYY